MTCGQTFVAGSPAFLFFSLSLSVSLSVSLVMGVGEPDRRYTVIYSGTSRKRPPLMSGLGGRLREVVTYGKFTNGNLTDGGTIGVLVRWCLWKVVAYEKWSLREVPLYYQNIYYILYYITSYYRLSYYRFSVNYLVY